MILEKIPQHIVEARARLMIRAVFFAVILYEKTKLTIVKGEPPAWLGIPCERAFTDGYNIVCNDEFMSKLSVDERLFVIAHEVWHVMAMHPERMRRYGINGLFGYAFLPKLYNICADITINRNLVDSKIGRMPPNCVWITDIGKYKVTGLETAEELYQKFLDKAPPQVLKALSLKNNSDDTSGEDQNLSGGLAKPGDPLASDVVPVSPDPEAEHVNEPSMKATVQSALQVAKSQGKVPAGLQRFVDQFLEPQVRWEEELREIILITTGTENANWSRPNRRKLILPGVYLPKRTGLRTGHVVIAIDTSGSVSDMELAQYLGETSSILGDMRPESLLLIWCDARVDGVEELDEPEDLRVAMVKRGALGGGGTSFLPPFQYLIDNDLPCDVFIYFTDGYGPFPDEEMAPFPTIWCISSDVVAPFGHTIKITY